MIGHQTTSLLADRSLYLCTPDRPDLQEFVAACIKGGVDVVQFREKSLEAKPLLARAKLVKTVCADYGVPFVLNDRPDLALEAGADGVHVGQDDAPVTLARRILGPHRIVGLSTHASVDLERARLEPVDYLSAGPVVPTPTKPGRSGTGMGYIEEAARESASWSTAGEMPLFVTGGVGPETVADLVRAGARRFVVVRYLTESSDPCAAAERLRRAISEAFTESADILP